MKKKYGFVIALLSITLIALEIIWTRIFSAEFFYTFAFLILSLAILGMGLGSLSLRLFRRMNDINKLWLLLSLTALLALVGPPAALHIGMEYGKLFTEKIMVWKFLLTVILLSAPFYTGGAALALIFKQYHQDIPRLYMADLTGAGTGVILAVVLMNVLGTQYAVFLASVPVIIASFLVAGSWRRIAPAMLLLLVAASFPVANKLTAKPREERAPVIYTHWDAMARIKVFNYEEAYRGINIDNAANSPVYKFDGNWARPDSEKYQFGIDVSYLINLNDSCTFLSLGAGGGVDVLQALQFGAAEIHAVEVNPHVNEMMQSGFLADFSGHIYSDPRVKVVTEDARTYIRRFSNKFDMIYSLSSNTFAALASGSFAMAENYLFTTEAFKDYYNALSDNGFMMMEHQFYMPRLATEALDALTELGVENPRDHIAIYDLPQMRRNMILLAKKPLTDEIRNNAFAPLIPEYYPYIHLLYPAVDSLKGNLINRIVTEGWQTVQKDAALDISPCDDNRPYTAQLGLWKNFDIKKLGELSPWEFTGFPLSKLLIVFIMAVILVLIIPLNLLPYIGKHKKLGLAGWLYYFSIGVAFMVVEIVLLTRYTLFIGSSSYTIVTILFTLLLGSGLGSLCSEKFNNKTPFILIFVLLCLELVLIPSIQASLTGLPVWGRMLTSFICIFPLAFFMGMPFPKAAQRVGDLVDWGFAVNGAASVLASTGIMLVSFSFGLKIALVTGLFFYVIAFVLMQLKTRW
ncbi:MAG TPA: hypothetical protein PLP19_15115 [bacterium]|nr:hypothetical protein [bacterium]HPN44821.1 hypothetical protein [bacterium]